MSCVVFADELVYEVDFTRDAAYFLLIGRSMPFPADLVLDMAII
jgi:hypothetical protein